MTWKLEKEDLKRYPHFDKHLSIEEIDSIVKDSTRVKSNAFFPFIKYEKAYQPFRKIKSITDQIENPGKKIRAIRYACRRDAYIFSYYRHLISEKYEPELQRLGIQDCVIAYRKVPVSGTSGSGKCNIEFAKDAFDKISSIGDCTAIVLDITKYFESLDHEQIRTIWCRLFGFSDLPPDHKAVFKHITNYMVVDREQLYERLGYFGEKIKNGKKIRGYLVPFKKIPYQLCNPKDFREKIAGKNRDFESLIITNKEGYGIPQGAPISDIIANFYLLDFDVAMHQYAVECGGYYSRYSDDIILIMPGQSDTGFEARDFVISKIKEFGDQIKIEEKKCSIVAFSRTNDKLYCKHIDGKKGKNGLEYLGFRFNGNRVYLKDSTLSNLYRKISGAIRHDVRLFVKRNPDMGLDRLLNTFSAEKVIVKFGRAKDFDENKGCKDWTFWTYARRAAETFGPAGASILYQMKRHRKIIKKWIIEELQDAAPS